MAVRRLGALLVLVLLCTGVAAATSPTPRTETGGGPEAASARLDQGAAVERRVACQIAIADLEWSHSLWPADNPSSKPARRQRLSDAAIRAQTIESLRMETALARRYGVRIDARALQNELDHMATNTRSPERLAELYGVLGQDASKVADCLARPYLVRQRLQQAFASDQAVHGALQARARRVLQSAADDRVLAASGASLSQVVLRRRGVAATSAADQPNSNAVETELNADAFDRERARLQEVQKGVAGPMGKAGHVDGDMLSDQESGLVLEQVVSISDSRIEIRRWTWAKQSFGEWWSEQHAQWSPAQSVASNLELSLPPVSGLRSDPNKLGNNSWRTESIPAARRDHTAVWTGAEMIIWGGYNGGFLAAGYRYNPATDQWTPIPDVGAPSARSRHSAVWTGTEMIVWGGYNGSYLSGGGRFDPATGQWLPIAGAGAPSARDGHTAVWTGSRMIVWGGADVGALSGGARYSPAGDFWEPLQTTGAPAARTDHVAVWTGDVMVVWGGRNGSALGTGGRYDPVTDSWKDTAPGGGAPAARFYHSAVWTGADMVIWGGKNSTGELSTGARYDPVADSWRVTQAVGAPSARHLHSAVWTGAEMIVFGGAAPFGTAPGGGRYDPVGNAWSTLQSAAAPIDRVGHSAIWTGSEVIVWGGGNDVDTASGGRFNPTTNSWSPTRDSGAPSPREQHTAVWTGNEMIVWGGVDGVQLLGDGGRYNPALDHWNATTSVGAPTARSQHTAIWTGAEMAVWGGANSATGARYDPLADSWVPTQSAGAPAARSAHTAVWTGAEMIIWGGQSSGQVLSSGSRYTPATDSWRPLPSFNLPRTRHSAIWTGAEMVIWGGFNGAVLSSGGIYKPFNDTWRFVDAGGAASARADHTAIWNGREMVIWGGVAADGQTLASGATYDVDFGAWLPMNIGGVPAARSRHTALWTGSEMIIWGGENATPFTFTTYATGGRYRYSAWTATDTAGAPAPRSGHTAVWTGTEMIVWGGCCYTETLGIYYPAKLNPEATFTEVISALSTPSVTGQSVEVQSLVVGTATQALTGQVVITADSGESCTARLGVPYNQNAATYTCTLVFNTGGSRSVTASYTGSATHLPSTSAAVTHQVDPASTFVAISRDPMDPSPVGVGAYVEFVLSVLPPGGGSPTGTVTISDGQASCTAVLPSNHCTITLQSIGARNLVASYSGSSSHLASTSAAQPHTVQSQGLVYWGEYSTGLLRRASTDGSNIVNLALTGGNLHGVATTPETGRVYFGQRAAGLGVAWLDGTGQGVVADPAPGVSFTHGVALDSLGRVYFSVRSANSVYRVNADGTGLTQLLATGSVMAPHHIALDEAGGRLFVADYGNNRIAVAPIAGGAPTTLQSAVGPVALAYDPGENRIYWSEYAVGRLLRAVAVGGSAQQQLATGYPSLSAITIDQRQRKLWWAASVAGVIVRANLDGSAASTVINLGPNISPEGLSVVQPQLELTNTTINSESPDPSVIGQPVTVSIGVQGQTNAPASGQVTVSASSGESCSDDTPVAGGGNLAVYSCVMTLSTAGTHTLQASFSASTTHDSSVSAAAAHTVVGLPELSVGDVAQAEGTGGSSSLQFTVTRSHTLNAVSVDAVVGGGTATAGSDYTAISGQTLSFVAGGPATTTVTVPIIADSIVEPDETLQLLLLNATGATISDAQGTATLINDDSALVTVNDVLLAEGDTGTTSYIFNLSLSGNVQGGFAVPYASSNAEATAGSDYTAVSGNLSFGGSNGQTRQIAVAVSGDMTPELDERFYLDLGDPGINGVSLSRARAIGTLVNDDLYADIEVTNSNGASVLLPGAATVYAVTVRNLSSVIDVPLVAIAHSMSPELTAVSWTCQASGGASCPASGVGTIATTLAMPRGAVVSYAISATVAAGAAGASVINTVTASLQAPYSELNPTNNSVTDGDIVLQSALFQNGFE